jgi:hypothetical protein
MFTPSLGTPHRRQLADRPWVSTLVGGLLSLTLAGSIVALVLVGGTVFPGLSVDPGLREPLRSQTEAAPVQVTGGESSLIGPAILGPFPEPEEGSGAVPTPPTIGEAVPVEGSDGKPESLDNAEHATPPGEGTTETVSEEQSAEEETSPPEATTPAGRTSERTKQEKPKPERVKQENPKPEPTKQENPKPERVKPDEHEAHGDPKAEDRSPPGQDKPPTPQPGHGGPPGGEPPGHQDH